LHPIGVVVLPFIQIKTLIQVLILQNILGDTWGMGLSSIPEIWIDIKAYDWYQHQYQGPYQATMTQGNTNLTTIQGS